VQGVKVILSVAFKILCTELDQEKIVKELDQCLVNGDEIDSDWNQLEDPYHSMSQLCATSGR
jgi:hypothetical protein